MGHYKHFTKCHFNYNTLKKIVINCYHVVFIAGDAHNRGKIMYLENAI